MHIVSSLDCAAVQEDIDVIPLLGDGRPALRQQLGSVLRDDSRTEVRIQRARVQLDVHRDPVLVALFG